MELSKKKIIAGVVAAALVILGATSLNKCPWLKKHWDENVTPLLREAAPDTAPVTSE